MVEEPTCAPCNARDAIAGHHNQRSVEAHCPQDVWIAFFSCSVDTDTLKYGAPASDRRFEPTPERGVS